MALISSDFARALKVIQAGFKRTIVTGEVSFNIRVSTHEPRASEVDPDVRYDLTLPTRTNDFPFAFLLFSFLFSCIAWSLTRFYSTWRDTAIWKITILFMKPIYLGRSWKRNLTRNQSVRTIQSQSDLNSNCLYRGSF